MAGMYGCFKGRNSDGAAMASGPPDVMVSQEPEVQEESSGKKKSKFQTFKNFFAKKKRKEPSATGAEAGLTASQSTDNVSKTSENNTLTRSEKDKGSGSKISLGSKALSHDSVFVSESSEANEALGASQDSIHGKVKSLQFQLKQAIILGSPPSLMCVKRTEDGTTSEDDGLPCSPPEYTTHHTAMNQTQRNSSVSLEGIDSDGDQLSCAVSSRAVSPLVVPGDFSQPASPFGCLDNSAAKHKLGLRHKACNKRKPASKLEVKAEGDSLVDDRLSTSVNEAVDDEQEQQTIEALSFDELKPKVEKEEEEEEEEVEEEEEIEQPQHSRQSLLINSDEAEQDVFHDPDTSSPPEQSLSEEEVPDIQPLPSSKPSSSRASSLDSPRASPEPAAAAREYLLDPPDTAYGAEDDRVEMELALTGDRVQEHGEEECSLLQEVLSSLKTPLLTCSLDMETEGIIQKMEEEAKEQEREEDETEEGEEMKEEEVDEPVTFQAPLSGSLLVGSTAVEEEEAAALSCQGEVVVPGEEAAKEDEEVVVEQFCHHSQEEEAEKVKPEDENYFFARKADVHTEEEAEEEYHSEREEEVIELEMESGVEEEGRDKTEEDDEEMDVMEEKKTAEEAIEAIEEEKDDAEEMTEWFPDAAAEEVEVAMLPQEVDEGVDVVVGDDTVYTAKHTDDDDDEMPTEPDDEEFTIVHECQTNYSHSSADGEERAEEVVEIEHTEQKSDQEEDEEANQPVADETEQGMEQESVEMSHLDLEDMENDQTEAPEQAVVSAKPPSLSLPTSHFDTQPQESGAITPSKISTTTLHINLVSPSSEKATSFFQKSPITAEPKENSAVSGKQSTASTEEEQADCVEEVEEEAPPPASVVEVVSQPSRSSDHSKVRFTIAPVWQRSHSLTPPSSPSACVPSSPSAATGPGDEEVGAASTKDPAVEAQPTGSAKAELVLSPSKTRNAGSSTAKPQDSAADIEESSVIVEGNPDNPFGVRLRKTPVLHRLSSEEESPSEPLIQPTVCKAEPPQPTGVKPLINQPNGNKPALPKKPDVHGDSGGKTKCISGPPIGCGVSGGSDSPSWISVARQKQMIYKDNSLDEITVKKEGQERKSSLPVYISSAASRQQSSHTAESANKVSPLEISKPPESLEKDTRRALAPPTPVPPQPLKSQLLPCPVSPKPPSQPYPASRTLSPPTPVPRKSSSSPSPPSLSKCATFVPSSKTNEPQDMVLTSSPFSDRTALEKSGTRAPGLSGQTSSSQRGLPPPALPQDEPPWMALAKKKAKAWSEMPQIVQ